MLRLFEQLNTELARGRVAGEIYLVGGAVMCLVHEARPSTKDLDGVYKEIREIRNGGANGSIIGRNTFTRPRDEAMKMLDTIIDIYKGKV